MSRAHQKLPPSGPEREELREKGQFWTPQWVAEAMIVYVLGSNADHVFDPAVGAGAFFTAAKNVADRGGVKIRLLGTEVDRGALDQAKQTGLTNEDLAGVEIRDFLRDGPDRRFSAIAANPPYIRHHRLSGDTKRALKLLTKRITGRTLDGRAGYHVFFLIKALERLSVGGRLAFIMPADTCEGVFAPTLWKWILENYRLDAVVTFSHEATPFPNVDTNAMIFMISGNKPERSFKWCRCNQAGSALREWVEQSLAENQSDAIHAEVRDLTEGFETGLSRPPQKRHTGPVLGDFARAMRGIASGANDYFFMTRGQAATLGIPLQFFVRAVGRTRDVPRDEITSADVEALEQSGRATHLLSLPGSPIGAFPEAIQRYIEEGITRQVHERALIRQRHPWYKMEAREAPPFLFAYLGRRNARFIRNTAGVVPLTGFLCVYGKERADEFTDKLWRLLNHEDTIANLARVGKSYGSGAIKVEPRALERAPLSDKALAHSGLLRVSQRQFSIAF